MRNALLKELVSKQNPDGGWGYFPSRQSAVETTAYGLMALQPETGMESPARRAAEFLGRLQTVQGGWPVSIADVEPACWVSALAALALLRRDGCGDSCRKAVQYLHQSFGRVQVPFKARLGEWLGYPSPSVVDPKLGGWGWNPGTAKWVEPTCYSLTFLNEAQCSGDGQQTSSITTEAEAMIYDRMCPAGGWNYGNARVMGEDLRPYPLTTALALIALQRQPARKENQISLQYLQQAMPVEQSALALCFAALCLDIYAQDWQPLATALERHCRQTQFLGDLKTVALAVLVLRAREGVNAFRFTCKPG